MPAMNPIDPNAYDPTDESPDALVAEADFDPLGEEDASVDCKGFAMPGAGVAEAERAAAPDEEDVLPYLGNPDESHIPEVKVDDRPAETRIAELLSRMKTRRKVLLGVLALCAEPVCAADVYAKVDEMQVAQRSVFDGPALCALLERAGALEQLREEAHEPRVVEVDGVECLEPAGEVEVRFRTTPAGLAALEADRPADRLREVFERDAVYKPICLRILKACGEEGGKSAKELGELVDRDPLVQSPRFWAAHFFNILGECDALTWNRTWKTTDVGWRAIEELELGGVAC